MLVLAFTRTKLLSNTSTAFSLSFFSFPNLFLKRYIIAHCEADVVFVDGKEELEKVLQAVDGINEGREERIHS